MTDAITLSYANVGLAALLLLVNGAASIWLKLGLERRLAVAGLRAVVQLSLLGYILKPVFQWEHWAPVAALGILMTALAARESVRRTGRTYRGIYVASFWALVIGCGGTTLLGTTLVVGVDPWWRPQYLIPLLGMILGNALTGLSIGMDRVLSLLDEQRGRVEGLLALGATWWEAARPIAAESMRVAMIPILNSMSAVGLVTIPGMMTGQILAGGEPEQAARYQMVILFLIAAAVALSSMIAILATLRVAFDSEQRLRPERFRAQG